MNEAKMKKRTKEFAKDIISLCRKLPNNREGRLIGNQIFRSGTSVAANYRAACRARSKAEFISKLSIPKKLKMAKGILPDRKTITPFFINSSVFKRVMEE